MKAKTRSPRYPQFGIREAIEKIKLLYQKEHTHLADKSKIANDLGYSSINGASLSALATLKQYNLLESIGDKLRVTADATTIIELPREDINHILALRRVVFSPRILHELFQNFEYSLPTREENVRLFIIKKGFNKRATEILMRVFIEAWDFIHTVADEFNLSLSLNMDDQEVIDYAKQLIPKVRLDDPIEKNSSSKTDTNYFKTTGSQQPRAILENLQYRLSEECKVKIFFEGHVTKEAIEKLIAYLEFGKIDYPSKMENQLPVSGAASIKEDGNILKGSSHEP